MEIHGILMGFQWILWDLIGFHGIQWDLIGVNGKICGRVVSTLRNHTSSVTKI
jgi:hypothetical protein